MKGIYPHLMSYAVVVLAVDSALLLTLLLQPLLTPTVFVLFFAAVAVSAWYGGMKLGILAIVLSTLTISYFFIEPVFSISVDFLNNMARLSLFVLVTIFLSWLNSQLRTAKQRLEAGMQKLKASELRFRRLAESKIIGVIIYDTNGAIIEANNTFLKMVGYTREDLLAGRIQWRNMTPPEYLQLSDRKITEVKTEGVSQVFEKEYICKDGSRVPILMGTALLQESDEQKQEIIGFCLDLSEQQTAQRDRQQVEQALQQQEDQLYLITDALPVLISYVDTQQCYRFNNKQYEKWFGIPASQTYGKHIKELLGETIYQRISNYVELVLSGEQVTFENQIPNKDGTIHDFTATFIPHFNNQRQVEGFIALIQDITVHKQAEEALKASEERLRKLTEKVRVIPWEANAITGNFTYVGPQTVEILGYPLANWYEDNFWDKHIHPDDQEWAVKYYKETSLSLDNYEFEYRMLAADGRVVWLYDIVNVVRDEDEPQLMHGFMIDITERKHAEQEREKLLARERAARAEAEVANRMKDEFLATLSHELRTPLNAMLGWTQLLKSRKFDEHTTARALETINRNTHSLSQLIEDVLDVSRIIRGKLYLNIYQVKIISVIDAAIDTVRPAAEAKEICVECKFDPTIGIIMGDANRLQQVMWNLLSNAIKFTPKGGRVDVKVAEIDSRVQIQVSDTGEGIAPNFLPFVFDRFRQADSSKTRSHGGLGLGLAIVRHLVELHGGTVTAESPGKGQGATFIVNLPMKAASVQENSPEQPSPLLNCEVDQNCLLSLEGLLVLVVDDELDTRQLLTTILSQYGAEVMAVASTAEALEALPLFHPDVLVSDIGMPQEDGYTLIRKLRTLSQEQGGKTPAVALTAYARAEDRTQALLAGFQLHIPKPVNPAELAAVVANLAGRT